MSGKSRSYSTDPLGELEFELAPLTTREKVALFAGVSLRLVDRALARGELRRIHIGRSVRIPRAAVRDWLSRGSMAD